MSSVVIEKDHTLYIRHIKGMVDKIVCSVIINKSTNKEFNRKTAFAYCGGYIAACENFDVISENSAKELRDYCTEKVKAIE